MNNPKDVFLHGWDSQGRSWHGPIPLVPDPRGARTILAKMNSLRRSFQGKIRCSVRGLPAIDFYTSIYDLTDAGLALVHLERGHAGPVGVAAVVPGDRRGLLRDDFAFELMSVINFLGAPINRGSELTIHDYIEESLRKGPSATHIFALETAELDSDLGIVLSAHFENVSAAMLEWMAGREALEEEPIREQEPQVWMAATG